MTDKEFLKDKMSETPPSLYGWVDISREDSPELGDHEDFIRMLREAQMEDGLASPMTMSSSPIFIGHFVCFVALR